MISNSFNSIPDNSKSTEMSEEMAVELAELAEVHGQTILKRSLGDLFSAATKRDKALSAKPNLNATNNSTEDTDRDAFMLKKQPQQVLGNAEDRANPMVIEKLPDTEVSEEMVVKLPKTELTVVNGQATLKRSLGDLSSAAKRHKAGSTIVELSSTVAQAISTGKMGECICPADNF